LTTNNLFIQLDLVRERTLQQLAAATEETADLVPQGFRNTLRWNLGHILTVQENLVFKLSGETFRLPESYPALFNNGTSPADWQTAPPSLETLKQQLAEQPQRIKDALASRLEDKLVQPFKGIETVSGIIGFTLYHEGVHTGYMMAMRKLLPAGQTVK
jgi:uncharacterized damage-inducible protein DinB